MDIFIFVIPKKAVNSAYAENAAQIIISHGQEIIKMQSFLQTDTYIRSYFCNDEIHIRQFDRQKFNAFLSGFT